MDAVASPSLALRSKINGDRRVRDGLAKFLIGWLRDVFLFFLLVCRGSQITIITSKRTITTIITSNRMITIMITSKRIRTLHHRWDHRRGDAGVRRIRERVRKELRRFLNNWFKALSLRWKSSKLVIVLGNPSTAQQKFLKSEQNCDQGDGLKIGTFCFGY